MFPLQNLSRFACLLGLGYAILNADAAPAANPTSLDLASASPGKPGFTSMSPEQTGINFTNHLDEKAGALNRVLYNGSGVATGDFDGDGKPDVFFASLDGDCRLYRNLGDWKFADATAEAGVGCFGYICRGAVFADVNGDSALDLLVTTTGEGVLAFMNDGHGKFTNATKASGLTTRLGSCTLALADVDGNGTLDLYVANNRVADRRDTPDVHLVQVGSEVRVPEHLKDRFVMVNGQLLEYGEPDALYLNDGSGKFTQVSWTGGAFVDEAGKPLTGPPLDWGLTATFRDIDGNGTPDLYVCNDYWTPDRLWLNDGKGHFRAISAMALRSTSASSMGVDFADIDRDGHMDFFVVDMLSRDHQRQKMQMGAMKPTPIAIGDIENRPQVMRNTLQHARGDGTFEEIAYLSGLEASEWSWQPLFLDVDLDGYEDVLVTSGHSRDVQDADTSNEIKKLQAENKLVPAPTLSLSGLSAEPSRQDKFTSELLEMSRRRPKLETPIVGFRNLGGLKFHDTTHDWGLDVMGVHHGIASADFDGDGDLDMAINNLDGAATILRNNASAARVAVRLRGSGGNTQGIGARVRLLGGAVPMQHQEIVSGGRYLSGSDPELLFAAGSAKSAMTLEVTWRNGQVSTVRNVKPGQRYEIAESTATKPAPPVNAAPKPLFADVSAALAHTHHENPFDDFQRQLLLPNRLSQLGPGLCWHDLNGDNHADLIIPSGKDGPLAIFLGDGKGSFTPQSPTLEKAARDQTTALVWRGEETALLIGSSNFEDGSTAGESVQQFAWSEGKLTAASGLPAQASSTGAIAMADLDGRGNIALFVGGRTVPGRYPEPGSSQLFRKKDGQWTVDETASALFAKLGLVSGATFSDLNADGFPDLLVAIEWGAPTVFLNDRAGNFTDATKQLGLAKFTGWWNGVAAGDFDEDGRMDFIATNWGRNSKYEHSLGPEHPLFINYGDFNGDGIMQVVEGYYDQHMAAFVPIRGLSCSSTAMPFVKKNVPTYKAFGGASLDGIYGDRLKTSGKVTAQTLESTLFLNRGDRFEAAPLPLAAQIAPAFGSVVADFDGDGHEDVFLAQNFYAAQVETPRIDAGRGLWLKGDGKGAFTAMPGQISGIEAYGDGRGAAAADFDNDGRIDLAVAQNGSPTKLFRNTGAKPGLRVRLDGPAWNRDGLGAQIRLLTGKQAGPIRELHSGSGYWSQDSAVAILGQSAPPTELWVRWPGGQEQKVPIPSNAREIVIPAQQPPTARR